MSAVLTKQAIAASLKRLLADKPLSKVTVTDIARECGISRMTFYYHFEDIYDLVEWACQEDAARAIAGKKTADTWQAGLLNVFHAVREDRHFIMNVYRCMNRSRIEAFLVPVVHDLMIDVMDECDPGTAVPRCDRDFIVRFFEYLFIGCLLAWIDEGMAEEPEVIVDRIGVIMDGQMRGALERFSDERSAWRR